MSYLDDRADLAGRVAVVVGGGGGIGRACAVDLGRAGMHLALCDKDGSALNEVAAMLADAGTEVMTAELDARDADALSEFFDGADSRFGSRCDVLVNVVGGTFRQPFAESNPRGWDALIRTNFTWLLHSTQLAVSRMQPRGGGSIINITSIEGHRAAPGYAVYAAMKAAVTSLTRTLAVELAPDNIRVNTIAPDYIATPGLDSLAGTAHARQRRHGGAAASHRHAHGAHRRLRGCGGLCALPGVQPVLLRHRLDAAPRRWGPGLGRLVQLAERGLLEPPAPRRPGPPARRMTG